jgi:hypothetical protein
LWKALLEIGTSVAGQPDGQAAFLVFQVDAAGFVQIRPSDQRQVERPR